MIFVFEGFMKRFFLLFLLIVPLCVFFSCSTKKYAPDPYANSIRPSIYGEWVLRSMKDSDSTYEITSEVTLVFPEKPRNGLHGSAGVNFYNGTADITDKGFFCGTIAVTSMFGDEEDMETEANFLRLLKLCDTISVETLPPADKERLEMRLLVLSNNAEAVRLEFVQ